MILNLDVVGEGITPLVAHNKFLGMLIEMSCKQGLEYTDDLREPSLLRLAAAPFQYLYKGPGFSSPADLMAASPYSCKSLYVQASVGEVTQLPSESFTAFQKIGISLTLSAMCSGVLS